MINLYNFAHIYTIYIVSTKAVEKNSLSFPEISKIFQKINTSTSRQNVSIFAIWQKWTFFLSYKKPIPCSWLIYEANFIDWIVYKKTNIGANGGLINAVISGVLLVGLCRLWFKPLAWLLRACMPMQGSHAILEIWNQVFSGPYEVIFRALKVK